MWWKKSEDGKMNDKCFFSIIIPIYNAEKYLKRCIESVLNQNYGHFELILIDDGSTDKSGDICFDYKKKDSRIKFIQKENAGVSAARNDGIQLAQGEYIGFVDADDTIEEDCLEELNSVLEGYHYDCICFGINKIYQKNGVRINTVQDTHEQKFLRSSDEIKKNIIGLFPNMAIASVCNKIYAKSCIKHHVFVEMKTGEDFLFNIQLLDHMKSFAILEKCLYNYYRDKNEYTRSNSYTIQYITDIGVTYCAALELFRKWAIEDVKYDRVINNIMYGMFHNVLQTLSKKEYKIALKNPYVRKAIWKSECYSIREKIYKFGLIIKGI